MSRPPRSRPGAPEASPHDPAVARSSQPRLAVFLDFENIALGLREGARFDVRRVLDRLLEKGRIIVKTAYADWSRFRSETTALHESGFELIDIPRRKLTGKNSADIHLCVDALDLSWSKEHVDTFVIISGDSDFSPLVAKLKENGRDVVGLGMRGSTSPLLANACDEFLYYEDLGPETEPAPRSPKAVPGRAEAFRLIAETVRALEREDFDPLAASLVKDTLKRKRPDFSERALGYGSFGELLEDARDDGRVVLRTDARSGTYVVGSAPRARRRRRTGED